MTDPGPESDPRARAAHEPEPEDVPLGRRVPIEQLVDPAVLGDGSRPVHPYKLRDALPPGWILEPDLKHARRDRRLLAGGGWVLVIGMVSFGSVALMLWRDTFPKGIGPYLRLGGLLAVILLVGGFVAPMITRALTRGPGRR